MHLLFVHVNLNDICSNKMIFRYLRVKIGTKLCIQQLNHKAVLKAAVSFIAFTSSFWCFSEIVSQQLNKIVILLIHICT